MPCNWSTTASSILRESWTTAFRLRSQVARREHVQCRSYIPSRARVSWTSTPLNGHPLRAQTRIPSTTTSHVNSTPRISPDGRCRHTTSLLFPTPPYHFKSRNALICPMAKSPVGKRSLTNSATTLANPANVSQPPPPSSLSSATAHLNDAQLSRVTAHTVRVCIREGDFGDALYIVNSACHSVLRDPLCPEEEKTAPTSQLKPIAFGRPVSPRLAAHAFLHGLVRGGYLSKAQQYAKLMIQAGIPLKSRTLESVLVTGKSSHPILPRPGPFARVVPRRSYDTSESALQLRSGVITDVSTRAAVELLQTARTFGQQRTERMYRVLITTLLMQGEIIVASLLFVILIKDWELRKAHEVSVSEDSEDAGLTYELLGVDRPAPHAVLAPPYPDLRIMSDLLHIVNGQFDRASDGDADPTLYPCLQSLAIFAMFLDTGQLHTHRISSIIQTLVNCPKTEARVWILQDGQPVQVEAYTYFHDVLKRLIDSLGEQPERPPPTMSRRAYNTLLSYSLRHRFSPAMASDVLQHMCVRRNPPIPPDTATYNILLRSGTLLRRVKISEMALAAFRTVQQESGADPAVLNALSSQDAVTEISTEEQGDTSTSNMTAAFARLQSERLVLPRKVASPTVSRTADKHTVTSFINHLTSTGRPDTIARMLFDILPELHIIDHPATNGVRPLRVRMRREHALRRAVKHGPYIYASLINALSKAGEVGLAECVFILAQQAERASHNPDIARGVKPWRLTVHAYTSLMQCYANVAHRRHAAHKHDNGSPGSILLSPQVRWKPKARHHRQGYAQYIHRLSIQRPRSDYTRRQTARRNAMLLFRSMMSGGRSLLETMVIHVAAHPLWTTPRGDFVGPEKSPWTLYPDARFFNAALKLFAVPVAHRRSREFWARRARLDGCEGQSRPLTPMLRKLTIAMASSGYEVPEAYKHLLAQSGVIVRSPVSPRKEAFRQPFAFPPVPRDQWRADIIPVVKTKGLPFGGKRLGRMRRSRKSVRHSDL